GPHQRPRNQPFAAHVDAARGPAHGDVPEPRRRRARDAGPRRPRSLLREAEQPVAEKITVRARGQTMQGGMRREKLWQASRAPFEKLPEHEQHNLSYQKGVVVVKKFVSMVAIALVIVFVIAGGAVAAEKVWEKGTPTVIVGFGAGGGTDT